MGLSEDQKAMLKLVSQPDTSYEDIAALMGLSVDEVRAKVDDALSQLDQGGETAAPPKAEQEQKAEQKQAPTPKAEPEVEPEKATTPPPPPAPDPKPSKPEQKKAPAARKPGRKLALPEDKGARYGLIAGGAVVLVLILLLVTGVLGNDDESTENAATAGGSTTTAEGGSSSKVPTQAVLAEVGGSGTSGRALFGRAGKQVVLLVRVNGLDPAPAGKSYTVSIGKSSQQRVPLVASRPNEKGEIVGSFRIAPQILGLLASGYDRMEVSLVPDGELGKALKAAQKSGTAPAYGGTELASGDVTGPIVEAGEN